MTGDSQTYLCEGEADCICALSHGLKAVTATGGAGTWKQEWDAAFKGLDVVICYDADQQGWAGAHKAGKSLTATAGRVRILKWPEGMLESGTEGKPYWARLPKDHGQDLTDFFVTHGRTVPDLLALLDDAEVIEAPPAPAAEVNDQDPARFWEKLGDGRTAFRPALLAQEILAERELLTDKDGLTYTWCGTHYKPVSPEQLEALALAKLGNMATSAKATDAVRQVLRMSLLPEGEAMNLRPYLLCLPSGMLDLDTAQILPHGREYRATYMVPWDIDLRRPPDCPRFKSYMRKSLEGPWPMMELQEFVGSLWIPDNRYETSLFVVGGRGTGKSTLLDVLQHLVGEEHCSNIDLSDLEDQFLRARLATARLNIYDEADVAQAFTTKYFNSITSGKRVEARHLYQKAFEFRPACKLVFASNRFPYTRNYDEALYDRLILIRMRTRFRNTAKQDPFLKEKLFAEAPGVFAWSLVGLRELRRRGRLLRTKATLAALNEYRRDVNPLAIFWEERLTTDPEEAQKERLIIPKDGLYQVFIKWAEKNGFGRPMTSPIFFRRLFEHGERVPDLKPGDRESIDGVRVPVVRGIGLKFTADPLGD